MNDTKQNGYNLHILKTDKFKSVSVRVVLWNELKEEELSLRNMLINNLLFSSFKYDTNRKIAIKKEELYSINIFSSTYRCGTQIVTEVNLSCIDDKYTISGNFSNALEFLFECLNNPNVKDGKFEKKSFSIIKDRLISSFKSETENPSYYAYKEFRKLINNGKIYNGSILGSLESIEHVTPESLYDYYKDFFRTNHIDIYVVGNINEDLIKNELDKYICISDSKIPYGKVDTSYEKDFSIKEDNSTYHQSKLIMGASIKNLTDNEKKYSSIIYNIILGSSPNSKLFKNVREKNSYAYTVNSSINRLDGVFTISAGISLNNYENTKNEVLRQIDEMKNGNFTLKSIKNAKEYILSIINEIDDNPYSIIDHYNNFLYFNVDELDAQKKEIKKITKQDIINVAKKINIDTIYLLKEDENGKD